MRESVLGWASGGGAAGIWGRVGEGVGEEGRFSLLVFGVKVDVNVMVMRWLVGLLLANT